MTTENKYLAFALVTGSTLALANNIGLRGECEIHEGKPECKGIGTDPLHIDAEMPYAYGTNTATVTGTGPPRLAPLEAPTISIQVSESAPAVVNQLSVDAVPNLLTSTL